MTPWFVLSYPRSRTAWLSVFLNGAGVPCFHEAWGQVKTVKELRALMESKGDGPVVNSDCSNVLFFDELREEFPEAQYLVLKNSRQAVSDSLVKAYGAHDYQAVLDATEQAMQRAGRSGVLMRYLDVAQWGEPVSAWLYRQITGREVDTDWLTQVSGMRVQLTPETIVEQLARGHRGDLSHITRRMTAA